MNTLVLRETILNFLKEDLGITGDWSSLNLKGKKLRGTIVAKEEFILCGTFLFEEVIKALDTEAAFKWKFKDGERVKKGVIGEVEADGYALLSAERTALNLLQRLSGISTKTREMVEILKGSRVKLLDTRKTTPGLRVLEKYATRMGGALNHRFGLFDAVMVKDNHIKAYGSLEKAVVEIRKSIPVTMKVEVEVESEEELNQALAVIDLIDIVMLDNWEIGKVEEAARKLKERKPSLKVELSGGIDEEKLKLIKDLPIDFVSTSKVITGAKWVDISLEVERVDNDERP
ncbi:MAG: carboxylating nicotinate-nucleotide diphosphorylase [Desulfurobacteriaceae bacterium]